MHLLVTEVDQALALGLQDIVHVASTAVISCIPLHLYNDIT